LIEEDIKDQVKKNDVISYKFTRTSIDGKPICPRIHLIRRDLNWSDALSDKSKVSKTAGTKSMKIANVLQ
jgi:hypothetical protein